MLKEQDGSVRLAKALVRVPVIVVTLRNHEYVIKDE